VIGDFLQLGGINGEEPLQLLDLVEEIIAEIVQRT
jgi:hypothetical protein